MQKNCLYLLLFIAVASCGGMGKSIKSLPSWFITPKQNDSAHLYGVGQASTLEEATKLALVDAASRLIVNISSESTLLREENKNSFNEETRQKIKQNIEKIDFSNFKISHSAQFEAQIFVEIEMSRDQFISTQKEKMSFLDNKILNLNKNLITQNLIQKRSSLIKILELANQSSILAQILQSEDGGKDDLRAKLLVISNAENELNKLTDKVEFYLNNANSREIDSIIKAALNRENLKIAKNKDSNQIETVIKSQISNNQIYGSFITKIKIDFENISHDKVLASNSIEVSGSSVISEKEAYKATLESLKEKILQDGILKVMGILQ